MTTMICPSSIPDATGYAGTTERAVYILIMTEGVATEVLGVYGDVEIAYNERARFKRQSPRYGYHVQRWDVQEDS